ncbi:kinase-like protein [Artomyces pyxidatus]|uniref:Kinase-like protein n=1 Tax=Artomyces pyxidatus TaxID=48021 RepID=A0ACB8T0L3_9AGAM|nr:kinase-like protein [Artomyces pyxidatus]
MLLSHPSRSSSYHFPPPPTPPPHRNRSHLSLTTSASDGGFSSLENYTYSQPPDSPQSDTSTPSSASKTNAFFASPFSPSASPPRSPEPSVASHQSSKTDAFFSSPFSSLPTPPVSGHSEVTPINCCDTPLPPSRSLTADFFSTTLSSRPTPTPSLRSTASNASLSLSPSSSPITSTFPLPSDPIDATPTPKHRLPSLARLFPSRYSFNTRNYDDHPRAPPTFVDLEGPQDVLVTSPSSISFPPTNSVHLPREPHEHHVAPSMMFSEGSLVRPDDVDALSYELIREIGQGAFSHVWMGRTVEGESGVVAVKMIARASETGLGRKAGRGERASFLREVEVLQRLTPAHPSLPLLHSSFTLRTHHVLVLEYISGGELLEVVNSDSQHARLTESLLRRIWTELVGAVQWMHSRSVVHRDIKLENILLTTNPFTSSSPVDPPITSPLIKLTDFGLARVIDTHDPWLSTRCGSESYAAPELLVATHPTTLDDEMGPVAQLSRAPSEYRRHGSSYAAATEQEEDTTGKSAEDTVPRREGTYDGRETDAWAAGVVLFALVARKLPFDPPPEAGLPTSSASERRRRWVLRVVRGDWTWPQEDGSGDRSSPVGAQEVSGTALSLLQPVRNLVGRLLVSDARRRARLPELWDEPWMRGVAPS